MSNASSYEKHIASATWAEKRSARLEIDRHACQACLHDGTVWRLEVHHKTYDRLGCEDVENDLITLCAQCHEAVTSVIRARRYAGRKVDVSFVRDLPQSRKQVRDGMEDTYVQDHGGCAADYAQRRTRKPVEQGR